MTQYIPGRWFQIVFIFIPIWGNDQNWLIYFSDGSVQPPIRYYFTPWFAGLFEVFYCKFPLISDTSSWYDGHSILTPWMPLRKSLSTVDNNQLGQLDLHDLDLNDLNLAMSALVGCCFFLCFCFWLSFCRDLVLPCFFLFSWKRPMMGWWTFQQRHLRRHFRWSSPTKAMWHTRSISNAMLNLECEGLSKNIPNVLVNVH